MKYTYAYKDSDGTRHEASMEAKSREAVFEALRAQGIRAIKVVAADGAKANGEVRGVRKRMVVLAVVLALVAGGVVSYFSLDTKDEALGSLGSATRRQVIGDVAVVEKGCLTGWSEVFPEEGERFFASFAVPGVKAGQRNTTVGEIEESLSRRVEPRADDPLEVRQIKLMVEGMKDEARRYIAAGGTIVEYGKRLTERQDAEIAIYERTKAEIEAARKTMKGDQLIAFWEQRNDQLRNLGIKLVALPE